MLPGRSYVYSDLAFKVWTGLRPDLNTRNMLFRVEHTQHKGQICTPDVSDLAKVECMKRMSVCLPQPPKSPMRDAGCVLARARLLYSTVTFLPSENWTWERVGDGGGEYTYNSDPTDPYAVFILNVTTRLPLGRANSRNLVFAEYSTTPL